MVKWLAYVGDRYNNSFYSTWLDQFTLDADLFTAFTSICGKLGG